MNPANFASRREWLTAGAAGLGALAAAQAGTLLAAEPAKTPPDKVWRIGVISARIQGKPQPRNGHTWHFCQPFHPTPLNLDAVAKVLGADSAKFYQRYFSELKAVFGEPPFADTKLTHYYEADPQVAQLFADAFPGVQVTTSLEKMAEEVDAIYLGDASGYGEDHFDLIAPALAKGLPTFCDKPIGATVAGTRKILEFAKQHKAPLMSSSLFRHQWGTEEALRMRDCGDFGKLHYVIASQASDYTPNGWLVYGQHPTWMAMTLCGPGVEAVSMYAREGTCHALLTWPDRMPAEVWFGRPDARGTYCRTSVHFEKGMYDYTPALNENYWLGHNYQIYKMAKVFRDMLNTGVEPVPHQEILEVTAIIHAAVKSTQEKGRLVALAEVMG